MISMNCMGSIGRLGNQMFQYAALRSLAKKFEYTYCLPLVPSKMHNEDLNLFECFRLNDEEKANTDLYTVKLSTLGFDEELYQKCPDNVNLHGYFQDVKYFSNNELDIRKSFTFLTEHSQVAESYFRAAFSGEEVISLHIRRGDYLNFDHHPIQSLDYYHEALKLLPEGCKVLIFTDDIEWASRQEIFSSDRFFFSRNNNTAVDLCMQTLCSYHVIANSTYSWWGAWLASSKKVVKPRLWFGPPLDNYESFLDVEGWISL